MSATLYAISFRATGSLLGVCSLEKQSLPDEAAWKALRDRLVGGELTVTVSSTAFVLPADDLAIDAITGSIHDDVFGNPYAYRVTSPTPPRLTIPGDGTDKEITAANRSLMSGEPEYLAEAVTVKLQKPVLVEEAAAIVFEPRTIVKSRLQPPADLTFQCPAEVVAKVESKVESPYLLFLAGVPVKIRRLAKPGNP